MGLILTTSQGGLVLATYGADEAACAKALREHDDDLRLVPQDSDVHGIRVYKVFRYMGPDRPAQFVCGWYDEMGRPYDQLSVTGLLDMVQRLDRNTRSDYVDPDVKNEQLLADRRRRANEEMDEIAAEHRARVQGTKSSPLPRSRSLYLARSRVREGTKSNELKP